MAKYLNQIVEKYNDDLKALIKVGKNTFVIKDGIVGEVINLKTMINKNNEVIKQYNIVKKSSKRVNPKCLIYHKCGGCSLQHLDYEEQANIKTKLIEDLFKQNFAFKTMVMPIKKALNPYHYRNKSQVVFKYHQNKLVSGFYEEGTHEVIENENCLLQDEKANAIMHSIKELMLKMHIAGYDEDKQTGIIRHVLVKTSSLQQILVVIVVGNDIFKGRNNFVQALMKLHPEITTVVQNVNKRKTSAVLGENETVLYGKGYIIDELLGYKFKITSKSFYQINHEQTAVLYQTALNFASLNKNETLIDTYAGVGTIGLIASQYVKTVTSVEIVKDAVSNGIFNAKLNNINNIRFITNDATVCLSEMAKQHTYFDILIMDPPRSGSTKEFLTAVLTMKPKKIIYISCNPFTQVEDLKLLIKDYLIKNIQPVDLFPMTSHIENIVYLERMTNKVGTVKKKIFITGEDIEIIREQNYKDHRPNVCDTHIDGA